MTVENCVSSEASTRICRHMNEDHAVTVHAMARSVAGWGNLKVSNAKLVAVTSKSYTISYVTCSGDRCSMEKEEVMFDPPIEAESEVRSRLVYEHHRVLSPRLRTCVLENQFIAFSTLVIIITILHLSDLLRELVFDFILAPLGFHDHEMFHIVMKNTFYLVVISHGIEALYAMYLCKLKLGMKILSCFIWCLLVFIGGISTTRKLIELFKVSNTNKLAMKQK